MSTPSVANASTFYCGRLGFESIYRFPKEGDPAFVSLELGTFKLGLVGSDDPGAAGRVALWLYTDELDRQVEALRDAGVRVLTEPHDEVWGERVAAVADPDGNTVWLGQRLRVSV